MTVIVCPGLYPLRRHSGRTPARDAYLRANPDVSAAILADAMGLSEAFVINYQLKLGLRKFAPCGRKRK
jgi:hypothetical protein